MAGSATRQSSNEQNECRTLQSGRWMPLGRLHQLLPERPSLMEEGGDQALGKDKLVFVIHPNRLPDQVNFPAE